MLSVIEHAVDAVFFLDQHSIERMVFATLRAVAEQNCISSPAVV